MTKVVKPKGLKKLKSLGEVTFQKIIELNYSSAPIDNKYLVATNEFFGHYTYTKLVSDLLNLIVVTECESIKRVCLDILYFSNESLNRTLNQTTFEENTPAESFHFEFIFEDLLKDMKVLDGYWLKIPDSELDPFQTDFLMLTQCIRKMFLKYLSLKNEWNLNDYFS